MRDKIRDATSVGVDLGQQLADAVDILVGSAEFAPAWDGRLRVDWNGRPLWAFSRQGLMTMKRLSRRMKDLADLERLEEDDAGR